MADTGMMSNLDRLVYMANQIALNFGAMNHDAAIEAVADHIASFWDPRMRAQISDIQAQGGSWKGSVALGPVADAAVTLLRNKGAPPPQSRATEFHKSGHSDAG